MFVVRFGRSLWFCQLQFDKEAISVGFMAHSRVLGGRFRELSFYGPCGPYFLLCMALKLLPSKNIIILNKK